MFNVIHAVHIQSKQSPLEDIGIIILNDTIPVSKPVQAEVKVIPRIQHVSYYKLPPSLKKTQSIWRCMHTSTGLPICPQMGLQLILCAVLQMQHNPCFEVLPCYTLVAPAGVRRAVVLQVSCEEAAAAAGTAL